LSKIKRGAKISDEERETLSIEELKLHLTWEPLIKTTIHGEGVPLIPAGTINLDLSALDGPEAAGVEF